jgi:hypothetical protein
MRGLTALAASLVVVFAAGCSGEAPPPDTTINTDPVIPNDDGDELNADIPITLQEALGEFGACMDLEAWMRTGIYQMSTAETEDDENCYTCHGDGANGTGTPLSLDIVDTFDSHKTLPAVMRLVTGTVDERGNFKSLVPSLRYIQKGVDSCPAVETGIQCHPAYTLDATMQDAVTDFVNITLDRLDSDNCDAKFAPPIEE